MVQAGGLGFLFVPINTVAYSYLPREKNNAASGLINLSRNIGGSVGISLVTTMLARRSQDHQVYLSGHLAASNPNMQRTLQGTASALQAHGYSPADAMHRAYAIMQNTIFRQADMLAYIDNFWMLGVGILFMVPLVFLMKRPKPGGTIAVH
jgi:DHA2 family multidrug resistance protein